MSNASSQAHSIILTIGGFPKGSAFPLPARDRSAATAPGNAAHAAALSPAGPATGMPMADYADLSAFGAEGELHVVVECPRGSAAKVKYEPELGRFRSRAPCRWAWPIRSTGASFRGRWPMMAIPSMRWSCTTAPPFRPSSSRATSSASSRCRSAARTTPGNGTIASSPCPPGTTAWVKFERATQVPARLRKEIEHFFLDATFFTGKDFKIIGWRAPKSGHAIIRGGEERYRRHSQWSMPAAGTKQPLRD